MGAIFPGRGSLNARHSSTTHRDFSFSSWGRPDWEEVGASSLLQRRPARPCMRSPRPRDTPLQVQRPTPTPGRGSRTRRRVGLIVRPRQANRAGSPAPSRWAPLNRTCSKGPGVGARAPCSGWSRAWSRRSRHGAGGLWGLSWARPFLRVMCAGWSCVLLCPTSP